MWISVENRQCKQCKILLEFRVFKVEWLFIKYNFKAFYLQNNNLECFLTKNKVNMSLLHVVFSARFWKKKTLYFICGNWLAWQAYVKQNDFIVIVFYKISKRIHALRLKKWARTLETSFIWVFSESCHRIYTNKNFKNPAKPLPWVFLNFICIDYVAKIRK